MKPYCIDYRNGGLGNTVLSHVLFASRQVELDLNNFFSVEGNAHQIQDLNPTKLISKHLIEYPSDDVICVLQIMNPGWTEILRLKMSYEKSAKEYPTIDNYNKFFINYSDFAVNDKLWIEFYNNIKDQTWPECKERKDRLNLPDHIQQEIANMWVEPNFEIQTDYKLFEFLIITYYDSMVNPQLPAFNCPTYSIDQYLARDVNQLKHLSKNLGWNWDDALSEKFITKFFEVNDRYLNWLNSIKINYQNILANENLDWSLQLWENAVTLAKVFADLNFDPRNIKWQDITCFFENKSIKLTHMKGN